MPGPGLVSRSAAVMFLWVPALTLAINGCGARVLPAPKVPDKTIPELAQPAEPPERDEGQVVIDTTNGPAAVQVTLFGNSAWTHPICATTPCAANLPYGTYNVVFKGRNDPSLESKEILQVGHTPSVLRHTMGSTRMSFGLYFGGLLAVTLGATLMLVGSLGLGDSYSSSSTTYATLGLGAAATGAGIWMMYAGRPEITPSSSVQWSPGGNVPVPPASKTSDKQQVLRVTPTGFVFSFN
jgi:hypothetical protein